MSRLAPLLALVAAAAFVVLPFLALGAPIPFALGTSQKIFYYHVPAAWAMFLAAVVSGAASAVYLARRRPGADDLAAAAADLVVLFGLAVLTTGPIWAKAAWGAPWVWDARLTTSLLLFLTFLVYHLVRHHGGEAGPRLAAGVALFGFADVPLTYFAVNFWRTQHPGNRLVAGLPGQMLRAFLLALLAFTLLFVLLLGARAATRRRDREDAAALDVETSP